MFDSGRYADARKALKPLASAKRAHAGAAFYMGRMELLEGDGSQAAEWLERAVERESGNAMYQMYLGQAYGRAALRGSKLRMPFYAKKVQAAFETAVRLDPASAEARMSLMQYYLVAPGVVGGSRSKAATQARELLKRDPYRGRIAMGALAEFDKKEAQAEREYLAAVELRSDSALAYHALGAMYQRTAQYPKAFALYDRLVRARPNDAAPHYQIGRTAALSRQQLDRGEQELRKYIAHKLTPSDPPLASAHYRLGQVLEHRGDRTGAAREYEATLRLDPQQGDAQKALKRVR